jgi:integrase
MSQAINFTKAALNAIKIPAPGKRETFHDKQVQGLQLRVTSAGVMTFSVYRRLRKGEPTRITIGRFPDISIENARKLALAALADLAEGKNPNQDTASAKNELTLRELFDDFLEHRRTKRGSYLSDKTKIGYGYDFNLHLAKFEKRRLSKIRDTEIASVHTALGKEHPTSANRVLALTSSLFSHAKARKLYLGENPAKGIQKFPETSRDRFLQADELPRFFASLAEEPNQTFRDYVLISLLTGVRRSFVLCMRWDDVHLDRAEWRTKAKGGSLQTVPLTEEAITILKTRYAERQSDFVFPGTGATGHFADPKTGWNRLFDRDELQQLANRIAASGGTFQIDTEHTMPSNLQQARAEAKRLKVDTTGTRIHDLRIHDLRRTLGSWQAKTGASLVVIGKTLNHKSPSTTAIYARLDSDPVRQSMGRATSAIFAAGGMKPRNEIEILTSRKRSS